ncbi:hypothetical protein CR513_42818, partial [Mucuna pruriens]
MTFWNKTFCSYPDRFVVVLINNMLSGVASPCRQVVVYRDVKCEFGPKGEPFIVYSDASKISLSDVLMLKDLTPRQLKTHKGELSYRELVMLKTLKTLVDESRFEVFSDHKSLSHLLKMRQHEWLEFLSHHPYYNFDLGHHPSKVNVVVNVLSGKSLDSSLVCEVTLKNMKLGMLKVTGDLMKESREGQKLGLYLLD